MKFKQLLVSTALMLTIIWSANAQQKLESKPIPNAAESIAFLEKNKSAKDVITTPSGLQYKIIKQGKGEKPLSAAKVGLHYKLSYVNGKIMTDTQDKVWEHHIDKALPGMQEAIVKMPVGSVWVLYLPAKLAFGENGDGDIPAGTALICELELVNVID